jgi:hypothetical protein
MTPTTTAAPLATGAQTKNPQRMGGIAALAGAATNLLGLVVFVALLLPKGLGDVDADPGTVVALLADNETAMRAWYLIIYLVFGGCLIFLSLALFERLRTASPVMAQAVTIVGLIYAVLVIVIGTLSITDLNTVVRLEGENPAQAATVYTTLTSVETGLGAGGGETIAVALWLLLLSWTALQARALPRLLNYLGLLLGGVGILSVVLNSLPLMSVNGLALIIWFGWLGIAMLRGSPGRTAADVSSIKPGRDHD